MGKRLTKRPVLLVPVLPSERWTSIDLYRDALVTHPEGRAVAMQAMNPDRDASWIRRQYDFHVALPRALRATLRRMPKPVVHFLDQNYAYFCRPGIVSQSFPSIVTCHDLAPLRQRSLPFHRLRRYERRVDGLRHADAVACDSAHTARDVIELLSVAPERVHINPPGVDPIFRKLPTTTARLGDLVKRGPWVLHVGSNDPRKDLPVLLEAMSRLTRIVPEAKLVKVGPALAKSDLAHKLGLQDAIIDLGWVDLERLIALYNLADVLALPSSYEGFGRPLLEGMACGTPCVAAAATSLPEVGGDAVLYHAPGDAVGLCDRLRMILEDRTVRDRLASAGPIRATGFTWTAHAQRLSRLYDQVH